jgi:hypothetical protein
MHPACVMAQRPPPNIVRLLAYLGAIALLSMASAHFSQSPKVMGAITPVHQPEWIDIERPFAAFALSIPEAADVPASYAIRRHSVGNGRKDILTLGEPDSTAPAPARRNLSPRKRNWSLCRSGCGDDPERRCAWSGGDAASRKTARNQFGPLTLVPFVASKGTPRPLPWLCARLRQSTHAAVRLVLSGRHRVRRAKHARVRASID